MPALPLWPSMTASMTGSSTAGRSLPANQEIGPWATRDVGPLNHELDRAERRKRSRLVNVVSDQLPFRIVVADPLDDDRMCLADVADADRRCQLHHLLFDVEAEIQARIDGHVHGCAGRQCRRHRCGRLQPLGGTAVDRIGRLQARAEQQAAEEDRDGEQQPLPADLPPHIALLPRVTRESGAHSLTRRRTTPRAPAHVPDRFVPPSLQDCRGCLR